jgi:hypothetical protein
VDPQSAKEGDVVFEVPTTESNVILEITTDYPTAACTSCEDETTTIPFDLAATET